MGQNSNKPLKKLFDSLPGGKFILVDLRGNVAKIDPSTNTLQTIEYEHHEIHAGSSFTCHYEQDVSDTDDRTIIAFKTPNTTKYLHITMAASATALARAIITEAPTITDNEGDTLAVINRRRVGTPTASTIINTSPATDVAGSAMYFSEANMAEVTLGTELASIPLGAATSPVKSVGGLARAQQEFILKPNTLYAFEVISLDDSDNTHWIELDWYEHGE